MIGIYKITNLIDQKIYIGKSLNIENRWYYEKRGKVNKYLLYAFEKYGIDNFKFEVIEECSKEELNLREKYWTDFYHLPNRDIGYNLVEGGNENIDTINCHTKEELDDIIKRIKVTNKKTFAERNVGQIISKKNKGKKPWNSGKNLSKVERNKISNSLKEFYSTEEGKLLKEKISEFRKNAICSEEHKKHIALSVKRYTKIICVELNLEFELESDIETYFGKRIPNIKRALKNPNYTTINPLGNGRVHWRKI